MYLIMKKKERKKTEKPTLFPALQQTIALPCDDTACSVSIISRHQFPYTDLHPQGSQCLRLSSPGSPVKTPANLSSAAQNLPRPLLCPPGISCPC